MPRKPTTGNGRQRKMDCAGCGFICYASAGAIRDHGLPVCACGQELAIAKPRDLAIIDPDGFDALAASMPTRGAHNALMRQAGYTDMIVRYKDSDPSARARAAHRRSLSMARRKKLEAMPF